MTQNARSTSLFGYQVGDTPNIALIIVGYCCCCGLSLIVQVHNIIVGMKQVFPDFDDSNHWLKSIIGIWGLFIIDKKLQEEEAKNNITNTSSIPVIATIFVPILWPIAVGTMMSRLNKLAEVTQK